MGRGHEDRAQEVRYRERRLEGRFFATLIDSDTEIFCRSGADTNFCAVKVDGDLLLQWQAMAGLVFRF